MKLLMRYFTFFFLLLFSNQSIAQWCSLPTPGVISECDYCQCSQGISPMETGSTGIRFDVRSLYRSAFYNGAEKLANPEGIYETYLTNQLILNYQIAESPFTISATVPYVVRQAHDADGNIKGEGISDILAIVRYNAKEYINESLLGYSVTGGVKFATGSTNITSATGDTLDPHIRPGTGTTDFLIGAAGIWSLDRVGITTSITAGFVTGSGAPTPEGMHKFGNYVLGDITARYRIIPEDVSESNLSLTLGIGAETHGKETVGGSPVIASGETLVYLIPGLKYIFSTKISLDGSIQIPLYQYQGWDPSTGENQLGQTYRIMAGIQYLP